MLDGQRVQSTTVDPSPFFFFGKNSGVDEAFLKYIEQFQRIPRAYLATPFLSARGPYAALGTSTGLPRRRAAAALTLKLLEAGREVIFRLS